MIEDYNIIYSSKQFLQYNMWFIFERFNLDILSWWLFLILLHLLVVLMFFIIILPHSISWQNCLL